MFEGIGDTSPHDVSVTTEPRGRARDETGGAELEAAAPHLRGIIWLIRLPLLYSVSRYDDGRQVDDDVKFLNFSERTATFTYSLIL